MIASWAIVELMGHVKIAGRLSEEERFGAKLGRLDVPTEEGFVTQYFGGSSVYRITPVAEAVARDVAKRNRIEPVYSWDYPKALPPTSGAPRRCKSEVRSLQAAGPGEGCCNRFFDNQPCDCLENAVEDFV